VALEQTPPLGVRSHRLEPRVTRELARFPVPPRGFVHALLGQKLAELARGARRVGFDETARRRSVVRRELRSRDPRISPNSDHVFDAGRRPPRRFFFDFFETIILVRFRIELDVVVVVV
jgi:hypothetical protein